MITFVETLDEANAFMRWLGERRTVLAIDTETGGLDWWKVALRLVQFADSTGQAYVIPYDAGGWGGIAREALQRYIGQLVMHNAKFDRHMLDRAAGVQLGPTSRIDDTSLMAHVLDTQSPMALKQLAKMKLDASADTMQGALDTAMAKQGWGYGDIPMDFQVYWAYAATDAIWTAQLWDLFVPQLRQRNLWDVYTLDLHANDVLLRMEDRGVQLDRDYCSTTLRDLRDWLAEADRWVRENYGISATSNKQLADALTAQGVVLTRQTPGGDISVDAEALSPIQHPLAQTALRIRQLQKVCSTYLDNFMHIADQDDVIHPSIRCLGAKTGRMSMSEPNLQNLPRDHVDRPEAIAVRNCLVPREGNVLVLADFEQIEQRMMAHFIAQTVHDTAMVEAFQRGGDFFTNMAIRIYGDPSIVKRDPRRQMTKNASYAKGYGAGTAKFAWTAGVDFVTADVFMQQFDATYPGVRAFQKYVDDLAHQRRRDEGVMYVRSPFGRIHKPDEHKAYTLVNYLIQGTAGDVLKMKLVELAGAGLGDYMVLPIHDEVVFDVPYTEARHVVDTCRQVMPELRMFTVPLTVGVDVVARMGHKFTEEFIDV
jgi:DNA polymerase-1